MLLKSGLAGFLRNLNERTARAKQTRFMQTGTTDDFSRKLLAYIDVKLALLGERLLASYLSPCDQRIQTFLYDYLQDIPTAKLPNKTFVLDRPGLARLLSVP